MPPRPPTNPAQQSANMLLLVWGFGINLGKQCVAVYRTQQRALQSALPLVLALCREQGFGLLAFVAGGHSLRGERRSGLKARSRGSRLLVVTAVYLSDLRGGDCGPCVFSIQTCLPVGGSDSSH